MIMERQKKNGKRSAKQWGPLRIALSPAREGEAMILDLEAIKARHESCKNIWLSRQPGRSSFGHACADREDLIAEVERLRKIEAAASRFVEWETDCAKQDLDEALIAD